jgi:hypothetical protein
MEAAAPAATVTWRGGGEKLPEFSILEGKA